MHRPVAAALAAVLAAGCTSNNVRSALLSASDRTGTRSSSADTTLVGTAARMISAEGAVSRVWPGYWPRDQAFLLLLPPDTALLITSRNAPPEYQRFDTPALPSAIRDRAYLRRGYPADLANSVGRARYALGADTIPAFALPAENSYQSRLEFYYHEAFHGYQRVAFVRPAGEPETEFQKPSVDAAHIAAPEFRAMGEVERRMLDSALALRDTGAVRDLLRRYLAVRRARAGRFADVQAVERLMERREGTAQLVGCQAAAAAIGDVRDGGVACIRANLRKPLDAFANFPESDARLMRWRHYGTGAALGVLLDRLGVGGWRLEVQQQGAALDEIIARTVPLSDADASGLLPGALADFGYESKKHDLGILKIWGSGL